MWRYLSRYRHIGLVNAWHAADGLLVLRGLVLTPAELVALGKVFGTVESMIDTRMRPEAIMDEQPEVFLSFLERLKRHHTGLDQCDGAGCGDGIQPTPTHFASQTAPMRAHATTPPLFEKRLKREVTFGARLLCGLGVPGPLARAVLSWSC